MVKLYPTLIANSVSKNIIPGILKSIERYAMIYRMGEIMKQARKDLGVEAIYRKVGGKTKLVVKETEDQLINFLAKEFLTEQGPYGRYPNSSTKGPKQTGPYNQSQNQQTVTNQRASQANDEESFQKELEREKKKAAAREAGKQSQMPASAANASIGVGPYDMTSLMLEPSWMKIDMETRDGAKHSGVIGVKAVPIAVKSDAQLAHLIMWDKQIGKIMTLIIRMGRPIEGMFYRAWKNTVGKFFGDEGITGNPFKDIVMKRTILGTKGADDIFLVLNQADLPPDFASRARDIQKLFKLSWESFCIADDVNRRVAFCMKQFRGMCSIVPYSMLYQTLGQARVFEDMEDVRRSSGSLFKSSKNLKKVIGESMAQQKLEEFTADLFPRVNVETPRDIELLQEIELLDENFAGFVKKVASAPKQMITRAMKGTLKAPDIAPEKMAMMGKKINPDFRKAYDLSVKVLENSITDVQGKAIVKWAALLVVIKALPGHSKDLVASTREQLIKLVPILRKALRKVASKSSYKMKPPPSHWPEVFIGSVVLLSFTTVAYKLYQAAMALGAGKAVALAAGGIWDIIKLVFTGLTKLITLANDDPAAAKGAAKTFLQDFEQGLEGIADTWIILSFAIVGVIATYKLVKGKVKGGD
jgi:hypothetical protein